MPNPTPIYTAIQLARRAIKAALGANAHWQRNEALTPTLPYLVIDSQDRGGKQNQTIGSAGWRGLITIRAIASYQDEADAALLPVYAAMQTLTTIAGYTIAAVFVQPIVIPPTSDARYAAAQWEVFIERT